MQFLGFEFESEGGGVNQRLNCEVTVCHVDVCDSACMQGCFADNKCSIHPSKIEETISLEPPKTESFTHAVNMFQNTSINMELLAFISIIYKLHKINQRFHFSSIVIEKESLSMF